MLLAQAPILLPSQVPGDGLQVHEVAEAARVHSPISYWRQQASLKSVTGESSAWIGWPLNQRLFKSITAFSASSSRETWHIRSPRGGLRGCHRHSSPPPPHTSPPFLWKPPQRIHHNVLASLHCSQRSANRQQTGKSFEGYSKCLRGQWSGWRSVYCATESICLHDDMLQFWNKMNSWLCLSRCRRWRPSTPPFPTRGWHRCRRQRQEWICIYIHLETCVLCSNSLKPEPTSIWFFVLFFLKANDTTHLSSHKEFCPSVKN